MHAKLTLTKTHESHGETGRRYHQDDSELVAEDRFGTLVLSVKQGARRSPEDAPKGMESTPESVAAIHLTRDDALTLWTFLRALPANP